MFVAGPYRFKGVPLAKTTLVDIGSTEDGMRITAQKKGNPINVDSHGDTVVDGIVTGKSMALEIIGMEYSAEALGMVFPEGDGEGVIGKLWSEYAVKIVAEPIRGAGFLSFTFWKCYCLEPVELLFSGTAPIKIPMKFLLLPDYTKQEPEVFYHKEVARK